jgi:hypothetical protein
LLAIGLKATKNSQSDVEIGGEAGYGIDFSAMISGNEYKFKIYSVIYKNIAFCILFVHSTVLYYTSPQMYPGQDNIQSIIKSFKCCDPTPFGVSRNDYYLFQVPVK